MSKTYAYAYASETRAHAERRGFINEGYAVSLIGFNPENDRYEFDVYVGGIK